MLASTIYREWTPHGKHSFPFVVNGLSPTIHVFRVSLGSFSLSRASCCFFSLSIPEFVLNFLRASFSLPVVIDLTRSVSVSRHCFSLSSLSHFFRLMQTISSWYLVFVSNKGNELGFHFWLLEQRSGEPYEHCACSSVILCRPGSAVAFLSGLRFTCAVVIG